MIEFVNFHVGKEQCFLKKTSLCFPERTRSLPKQDGTLERLQRNVCLSSQSPASLKNLIAPRSSSRKASMSPLEL